MKNKHVGFYLKKYMNENGLSAADLTEIAGLSSSEISNIISGNRTISKMKAIGLEIAGHKKAIYWMTVGIEYELDKLRDSELRKKKAALQKTIKLATSSLEEINKSISNQTNE